MKAIETHYNGYRFRSRLEARWAVFFDTLGIRYEYEPEGFELSDGTLYLPDFYLPDSKSWFEVKGVMDEGSMHKIDQFIKEGNPLTVGHADMTFNACAEWWGDGYSLSEKMSSWLCRCAHCGKYWFMGSEGSYVCPCCGAYDGDSHFKLVGEGDLSYTYDEFVDSAINVAKRARFEHGENVAGLKLYENAFMTRW